jgi:putative CocE/NonD family hydrolase
MATLHVLFSNPPHLTAVLTHISCTDWVPIVRMHGGVAVSRSYDPDNRGGWAPVEPPPADRPVLAKASCPADMHCVRTDIGGWFDPFIQGSLDDWVKLRDTGKAVLVIGCDGHGALSREARRYPNYGDADIFWPDVPQFDLLTGDVAPGSVKSVIYYFLMGDAVDPDAPGNVWKVTDRWPLADTSTAYHMTAEGGLTTAEPEEGFLAYDYDPCDPAPSIGGPTVTQKSHGPMDQRPLKDRRDILRFATDPLQEAVEITGRVTVDLHVSTDVPDTTFVARLVDVYPDGFEAIILESAVMARYHRGLYEPEPLVAGRVYDLTIDLHSTALAFAPEHRIAVHVTSSSAGRYAVHPNSYEPVDTYEGAPIAHNRLHVGGAHLSRLVLPTIEPGVSVDYDPRQHTFCVKTGRYDK